MHIPEKKGFRAWKPLLGKHPRRDSNAEPTDSKSVALSIELRGL